MKLQDREEVRQMDETELQILYEDNHLLAVVKPHGLLTQPSGTEQPNLEALCKELIKRRDCKPGNVYLHAVHRLDKPASGVVLFAKTNKALSRFNASFRCKEVKKVYLALVERAPNQKEGTLEHYLAHGDGRAELSYKEDPKAKKASLYYQVIPSDNGATSLRIELESGRYHQIRTQLAAIGCPILGDAKYGANMPYFEGAIALFHVELQIPHPVTKQTLVLKIEQ